MLSDRSKLQSSDVLKTPSRQTSDQSAVKHHKLIVATSQQEKPPRQESQVLI